MREGNESKRDGKCQREMEKQQKKNGKKAKMGSKESTWDGK